MEAQFPMFFMIALAVGAGLLAVFVVWLSKYIANEKTRAQGIAVAAITVGVLLMGLFVTRSSVTPESRAVTLVAPIAASGGPVGSGVSIDPGVGVQVHTNHPQPPVAQARFAWGPLTIGAIAVAVIILLLTSKKGLAAALAGLGIVGTILLMILYAARHDRTAEVWPVQETIQTRAPEAAPTPSAIAPQEIDSAPDSSTADLPAAVEASSGETIDKPKEDEKAKSDDKPKAERHLAENASPTSAKSASKTPPPDWIDDEPSMDAGVYRAVAISGPYSTRRECEQHLDEPLRKAMMEYAETHLAPSDQYYAWFDLGYIRNNMIEDRYLAEEQYANIVGKMYNLHVRLKVEPRDLARFNAIARQAKERQAVESASLGGALVFGALVVLYGGLRFVGRKKPAGSASTAPAEATV